MTESTLRLSIDASEAKRGAQEFDKSLKTAKTSARETTNELNKTEESVSRTAKALGTAAKLAAAAAAAMAARKVVDYSDSWKQLEGRLRVVTKTQEEFNRVQAQVIQLADSSRSSLRATTDLYARLAMAVGDNQKAMQNILPVTEAIAKGVALTGESAASAQGAIVQFAQGLATNFSAAGQEIRSLQEQAPRVAKALADGLNEIGVTSDATAGKLNQLAQDGVITATNSMQALASQMDVLNAEFEQMPVTIAQAFTALDNAFLKLIGQSNSVKNSTDLLAEGILFLADNLETLVNVVIAASGVFALRYVAAISTASIATIGLSGTLVALRGAMIAAFPVVAIGAAIFGIIEYFDELRAVVTVVTGEIIKFANSIYANVVGALRGIIEAVKNTGQVFDGLLLDIRDFVNDPLGGGSGFSNTAEAISSAYSDSFKRAFDKTLAEAQEFNRGISEGVTDTLVDLKRKADDAVDPIAQTFDPEEFTLPDKVAEAGDEIDKVAEKTKKLKEAADPIAKIFENAATSVQSAFSDSFRDLFSGNLNSFRDFAGSIKNIFIDMLAQLATLAIASPVIVPIIQGVGGALGVDGGAIDAISGQLGGGGGFGGGGISNITDLASGSVSLSNFLSGNIGGFNAVNQFGNQFLGTGIVGQSGGVASASLSAIGAYAGIGGLITGLTGLGTGNGLIDAGLGGIGSFGGSALAGALGIGAAPLGILGAVALPAIAGLFGGKSRPHPASNFGGVLLGDGQNSFVSSSKHVGTETGDTLSAAFQDMVNGLEAVSGVSFANTNIQGGVDDGRGFFTIGNQQFKSVIDDPAFTARFDPEVEGDAEVGLAKAAIILAKTQEESIKYADALDRINTEGREGIDILSDLEFVLGFDKIGDAFLEIEEPISAFKQQMDALNQQFADARETAEALGLPLQVLEDKLAKITEQIRTSFNADLLDQYLSGQSGIFAALQAESQRYTQQLSDATEANADLALVEAIHAQNVRNIHEQYTGLGDEMERTVQNTTSIISSFSQVAKTLDDSIFSLQTGASSSFSPAQQLALAQQRFADTAARARSGDSTAASELPSIANTVIDLARDLYASSDDFDQVFDSVLSELEGQRDFYRSELQIAESQLVQLEQMNVSLDDVLKQSNILQMVNSLNSSEPIANWSASVLQSGAFDGVANQRVNANESAIREAGLYDVAQGILDAFSFGVEGGFGRRALFWQQNPDINAQAIAALGGAGIPTFATGGMPFSTMPAIVGERGAEVIAPQAGSMVIPIQNNAAMLNQMQMSNMHLAAVVRLLQATVSELSGELQTVNNKLTRLNTTAKRQRAA